MKHIVGFSGGIDSQACALWVRNRFPTADIILLNSDPGGNEDGATTAFIEQYSATVFPVIRLHPIISDLWQDGITPQRSQKACAEKGYYDPGQYLGFDDLAVIKGRFPSTQASFCTEILKLRPQRRWLAEHYPKHDYIRYTGKRRDESRRRSSTPMSEWDRFFECDLEHVIADWTKQMCFDYVRSHAEPINELYSLGFGRVGCAPCHQCSKEDILLWAYPQTRKYRQGSRLGEADRAHILSR